MKNYLAFKKIPHFFSFQAEHQFLSQGGLEMATVKAFSKPCISNSKVNILRIYREQQRKTVKQLTSHFYLQRKLQ